jgi:hypothetical protein
MYGTCTKGKAGRPTRSLVDPAIPGDEQDAERFCKENGLLSMGSLVDRMGGSP